MKNLILLNVFILTFLSILAEDTLSLPEKGSKELSFGIQPFGNNFLQAEANPVSSSLLFRFYISESVALRLGTNLVYKNENKDEKFPAGLLLAENNRFFKIDLLTGFQLKFADFRKTAVYGILDFGYGYSSLKNTETIEVIDSGSAGFGDNGDYITTTTDFGPENHFYAYPGIGFRYKLNANFSIGAEIFYGLSYAVSGKGKIKRKLETDGQIFRDEEMIDVEKSAFRVGDMGKAILSLNFNF